MRMRPRRVRSLAQALCDTRVVRALLLLLLLDVVFGALRVLLLHADDGCAARPQWIHIKMTVRSRFNQNANLLCAQRPRSNAHDSGTEAKARGARLAGWRRNALTVQRARAKIANHSLHL